MVVEIVGAVLVAIFSARSGAWKIPLAAGVAPSVSELGSRHSADVASTEERHS
jgi:hypothetical protein